MTQKTPIADSLVAGLESVDKKQISIDEIMDSLKSFGDDIEQISKLVSEEKVVVAEFIELLKHMPPRMFSIAVSTSELPIGIGAFTQAHIDSTGHLILISEDGSLRVIDLSEARNRDLMMAVVGDIVPKFKNLASEIASGKPQKPLPIQEIPQPEPLPAISVPQEVPIVLTDSEPKREQEEVQEEVPVELPEPEPKPVQEEAPVMPADENAKISEVTTDTLKDLEILGSEVFEHSPVSVYFDDWLVNLRQVILGFESSGVISVDEAFTDECEQIFRDIEDELASRLLKEAELEASAKSLAENKHLLGQIDAEYAAQSRDLLVRGKSAIDFLIKNMRRLEEELVKLQQTKTGYLNPLKRIAKEQKRFEVTQKLSIAKKRLALVVQNSTIEQEKLKEIDAEYAAQIKDMVGKGKSSTGSLIKDVHDLEEELAKIQQTKTSYLHPIEKIAKEQKRLEITQRLKIAKEKLALLDQNSGIVQKEIHDEYEEKKQVTITKMQGLEEEIASKATDDSLEARKAATNALANAVKSLSQRNTTPSQ